MGSYREVAFRELVRLRSTTYATHGLYAYPAKFIPQVVRYAIERYTGPGDWVFDPFAGYGTVAVEASLTGRNAIVWDLNPLTEAFTLASLYRWEVSPGDFEVDWGYGRPFNPLWDNIFYWHPREFYTALSRAWGYWHYEVLRGARDPVGLSRAYLVAVPLLKVTKYFSYADVEVPKLHRSRLSVDRVSGLLLGGWRERMVSMLREQAARAVEKVGEYRSLFGPRDVEVVVRTSRKEGGRLVVFDSVRERLDRPVRLLVTSPPYLQAQEYIRSFKLELAWMGYTGQEIRALASREVPYGEPPAADVRSRLYREYRRAVEALGRPDLLRLYDSYFKSLAHFLEINSDRFEYLAIFVGPVKVRGIRIPIDEVLREHMEALGFEHVETLIDRIASRRLFTQEVNPATGLPEERTPTEHLLVMRDKR